MVTLFAVLPGLPTDAQIEQQLARILAHKTLARSKRLQNLLRTIIEQTLKGEPGALKEAVLAFTLYEHENYDPREHSRVRVDATTLRTRLKQYYSTEGLHDEVLIDIPKGAYVASFRYRNPVPERTHSRTRIVSAAIVACLAILILTVGLRWRVTRRNGLEFPVQLTFDSGYTAEPSISADGNTLAYASDRGKDGIVHIWIQSGNGPPRQLTDGPAHDFRPELSPDGQLVAFRSSRKDVVSLFTVPASGGTPRFLVKGAYSQRFSPDGRFMAYAGAAPDSTTHIFVIDVASRGEPWRIDYGVDETMCPVWTPDGRDVVFLGRNEAATDWEYWIASAKSSGAASRRLGVQSLLRREKLPLLSASYDCPQDWIDNKLLFLAIGDEPRSVISISTGPGNAFEVPLSPPDWRPSGAVQALEPVLRTGTLRVAKDRRWTVFTAERNTRSVWSLIVPVAKPPVFFRAMEDPAIRAGFAGTWPGLSGDGNLVCFVTERYTKPDIVCKDLMSGTEKLLGAQPMIDSTVLPDTHGRRVAFLRSGAGQSNLMVRDVATGAERMISSECPVLLQWAAGESFFLCSQRVNHSGALSRIDLSTGYKTPILTLRNAPIHAQVSPDGRWLALVVDGGPNGFMSGYVISLTANPEDTSRWIKVTEERFELSLHWAPDGASIFFWEIRDGSRCLWGQRLDPTTKRLAGSPFAVLHRHAYRAYPVNGGTLAVAGSTDRLSFAMTLSDDLSNVWRASVSK